MSFGWRVVLQIDSLSRQECVRFSDVPVADPAHIAVVSRNAATDSMADRLFTRLHQALRTLSPTSEVSEFCGGPRLLACMARGEPTCRSVLGVVTGTQLISADLAQLILDWQQQRPRRSTVLPILQPGVKPSTVLPPPSDKLIALFAVGPIEDLAPDLLRAARVGGADYRLFISYRRNDAQELAEQLHDDFTHAGFRVFLDRFRGMPGRPFPAVLAEELAGMGLVLVIESRDIGSAPWVLAEVAFAQALRLGLLALSLPGGPTFSAIPARDRHRPPHADWKRTPSGQPVLVDPARQAVVEFVRDRYAQQALYRQLFLENLLHRAVAPHGLSITPMGGGAFKVDGPNAYLVQLAARPPRLADVRKAVTSAAAAGAFPLVLGAHRLLPPDEAEDLSWLAGTLPAGLHNEGRIRLLARSFASGKVPP